MSSTPQGERPIVFIGSSSEDLDVAEALRSLLDYGYFVKIWSNGVFSPGGTTLASLVETAKAVDFAIFVVDANDVTISSSRSLERPTARDNVIIELGLFIGTLGSERCFMVHQRGKPPSLPSDLLGVTPATYEPHSSGDLESALGAAAYKMRTRMAQVGHRSRATGGIDRARANDRAGSPYLNGPFMIVDRWNGLALDSQKPDDADTYPVLWTPHGLPWQQWQLNPAEADAVSIRSVHRGLVLTTDDEPVDRSSLWLDSYDGRPGQQWTINPVDDGFACRIKCIASRDVTLDADYDATIPAAQEGHTVGEPTRPIMYSDWNGECQQWVIARLRW